MDDRQRKAEVGVLIAAMLESFGQESTKARLMGYWMAIEDLPIERIQSAVKQVVRSHSGSFPPTPAEFRQVAEGGGSVETRAMLAWADVQKAWPAGAYKHIDFEDKLINAAVRLLGGWPACLSESSGGNEKFYRQQFLKTYASLARSGVGGDVCRPLAGIGSATVVGGKVVEAVPCRIGCEPERARLSQKSVTRLESTKPDTRQPLVEFRKP